MNRLLLIAPLALFAAACSNDTADESAAEAPAVTESMESTAATAEAAAESAGTEAATAPPRSPAPEGARAFFITPANGATVTTPFTVEFGIEGMSIEKAGVAEANSGHHHLLIDTDLPPLGMPIPADDNHRHFGDGSTSVELNLEPGEHTLQLLLGDYLHIPHEPPVTSEVLTVVVE